MIGIEFRTRRFALARALAAAALLVFGSAWPARVGHAQATFTLGGRIDDTGTGTGTGIPGVTVTLRDFNTGAQLATRVTEADGNYSFTGLAAGGNYRLVPTKPGFVFQPESRGRTNLNQNFTSEHFRGTPSTTTGAVAFSSATFSVNEGVGADGIGTDGTGFRVINVTRTDTSNTASVDYATSDGTADRRKDYTQTLGTLIFTPGEATKSFTVLVTDDRFAEPNETVNLTLSNSIGMLIGAQFTATLSIVSDDAVGGPSPVKGGSFDARFFVRQHYLDFLSREPDLGGLNFWVGQTTGCGDPNPVACRINVSAAFFLSIEFQETGFLAYRLYKAAYGDATSPGVPGTVPVVRIHEFLPDSQRIGRDVVVGTPGWPERLEANKNALAAEFVQRQRFLAAFPATLTAAQYVDALNANAGGPLSPAERDALVNALAGGTMTRAQVLRAVAEDETLRQAETNRAFVLMQYYGYLRRNPDDPPDTNFGGWFFWLDKLNQFNGNFVDAQMVQAFLDSIEYGDRFGH
jgi:hypothetical protein